MSRDLNAGIESRRTWTIRDGLACWALLVTTGTGAIYNGGIRWMTWPGSALGFAIVAGSVTCVLTVFVMGSRWLVPTWLASLLLVAALGVATIEYLAYVNQAAPWSDNTTALEIGFRRLLSGENPYTAHTQLGNAITPMLGGFILAGPVVLLSGSLASYGMVWLYSLAAALAGWRGTRSALAAAVCLLVSPFMRLAWPNQLDYWINAAAIVAFGSVGLVSVERSGKGSPWRVLFVVSSTLFGFALAYRLVLSVVAVPLAALVARRCGWRPAALWLGPAFTLAAVLVLIPALVDRRAYASGLRIIASRASTGSTSLGTVLVCAVAFGALAVLSVRVRTLAGVWGAACVITGLGFGMTALLRVPDDGWRVALASYDGISGAGAVLVFGLAALVFPLDSGGRAIIFPDG